ncbi:MAG: 2OG-Fe(II) oxygenase [Alphaproteobacteria bacterium]|nr:2OG-Fe(II) oxygenase [Alphaproteobacteria bacterium]
MAFPAIPAPEETAAHFCRAMKKAEQLDSPYTRWVLKDTLPEDMCARIMMLPIKPPDMGDSGGVRDLRDNNFKRTFFTPKLQEDFPEIKAFVDAFQRPEVARQFSGTCNIAPERLEGGFLRIEYMQDTDGMWLKPHPDVTAKLFSMVIYLCTGPEAKNWGTDIYDADQKWLDRGTAEFNRAVIFVRTDTTFHGFEKRPIVGVRRLMEVNYVSPEWRDRYQLCLPDRPVTLKG